jgi:hypothetical protein
MYRIIIDYYILYIDNGTKNQKHFEGGIIQIRIIIWSYMVIMAKFINLQMVMLMENKSFLWNYREIN